MRPQNSDLFINKQSRIADIFLPAWGLGGELKAPRRGNPAYYEILQMTPDTASPCEHGNELSVSIKCGKFLD
jgi:hypothetical protein